MSDETKLKFECIYRLLYEAGLRIGEVLGLTLEDFKIIQDKSNNDICEHDAPTDELFCAYGLCQNQCHFFYNIPYYLSRFNDGKEIIDMNRRGEKPLALGGVQSTIEIVEIDYQNVVGQDDLTRFDKKKRDNQRNNRRKNKPGKNNK